jgi:hypothetical protein
MPVPFMTAAQAMVLLVARIILENQNPFWILHSVVAWNGLQQLATVALHSRSNFLLLGRFLPARGTDQPW